MLRKTKRLLGIGFSLSLILVLMVAVAPARSWAEPDLRTAISKVAKAAIPAVVHVEVTQKSEVANPFYDGDPFMQRFFDLQKTPKKFQRIQKGLGTGFLINSQGYILTNNHVVSGASSIEVQLADGRKLLAKKIGTDPKTDLAVIQISGKDLPYLKFGDSDRVEVGEWVVAIGHPRGLDQTVTQGIISAKHRKGISDPSSYQDFLQTDAAINPGNSGGPLLDLNGYVIGINSAIASSSGGSEGIGFAIPSNMAFHIAKALLAHGKVERGWLGANLQDLTYEQARQMGLSTSKGVLVMEVVKGGPAEKAGLLKGDVILDYSGAQVADAEDLRNRVATAAAGQEAKLTVLRKSQKLSISVRIASYEAAAKVLAASIKSRLGIEIRPVTDKEASKYGLESPVGVAITALTPGSPLNKAGLEVNDIILGFNGQVIENMDSFVAVVNAIPANQLVALLVLDYRSGNTGTVRVRLK